MVSVASVLGAYLGESEKNLRALFQEANENKKNGETTVLFFDEIDALCPERSAEKPHESRIVSQLLTLMDEVAMQSFIPSEDEGRVVIIGATNRPNAIDRALRRPGRFDKEIEVNIPHHLQRIQILKQHSAKLPLSEDINLDIVARWTHGYSGADLAALCREAAMQSLASSITKVGLEDFRKALPVVPPSIGKGYEVELHPVKWTDIGGLEHVKKCVRQAAEWPLLHREAFERLGLNPAKGILLYGPPGCCKTTLAKAVATGCGAHLIPLSCAKVYSMYSGEGEGLVREVFRRARLAAPSIILLDEVDAIATARLDQDEGKVSAFSAQLLSCLLTEMDGLEKTKDILVLAATNQPEKLDAAFIRPGRIDRILFVGPPDKPSRRQILSIYTKNTPLSSDVDLDQIASRTEFFTGAELSAVCSEAAICALREDIETTSAVKQEHFHRALTGMTPTLTLEKIEAYKTWASKSKAMDLDH